MRYIKSLTLRVPTDDITCVAFSLDGNLIASGFCNIVRVWRVDTGHVLHNLIADKSVSSIAWGPGHCLFCGLESGYLICWTLDEAKQVFLFRRRLSHV